MDWIRTLCLYLSRGSAAPILPPKSFSSFLSFLHDPWTYPLIHSYVEMNSDVVIGGCPPTLPFLPDFIPSTSTHTFSLYLFGTRFGTLTLPNSPYFGYFFKLIVSTSHSQSLLYLPFPFLSHSYSIFFVLFVIVINYLPLESGGLHCLSGCVDPLVEW